MQTTRLEKERTSKVHRQRGDQGLDVLRYWVQHILGIALFDWEADLVRTNQVLAEFVQYCKDYQVPFWKTKHALLGAQTEYRGLRGKIPRPWDALKSWGAQRDLVHRAPLPFQYMLFMSLQALDWALSLKASWRVLMASFSILIRLGFRGLLRPSELCGIRKADIIFRYENGKVLSCIVALIDTKTRTSLGRIQHVLISDVEVVRWVEWWVGSLPANGKLWPSSVDMFRRVFKAVLARCELGHLPLSPASLRGGGATELYQCGIEIARIQFLGRWLSGRSLVSYIQEAMGQLVQTAVRTNISQHIEDFVSSSLWVLAGPPAVSWKRIFTADSNGTLQFLRNHRRRKHVSKNSSRKHYPRRGVVGPAPPERGNARHDLEDISQQNSWP